MNGRPLVPKNQRALFILGVADAFAVFLGAAAMLFLLLACWHLKKNDVEEFRTLAKRAASLAGTGYLVACVIAPIASLMSGAAADREDLS